jgi:hydrogenase-4 component E
MATLFILFFIITLFYIAISGRLFVCINLLIIQGLLLFGVALYELKEINIINLLIVLLETALFKAWFMPTYLKKVVTKNKIKRSVDPYVSGFNSIIIVSLLIVGSILLAFYLHNESLKISYLAAAFSGILTGLFIIISRKEIIMHIVGYVVLENGIVILSFSVGNQLPLAVNAGILLDILISVLIFGLFINKIGRTFKDMDISHLKSLTD